MSYFLSAYLAGSGNSQFRLRHDQAVALWEVGEEGLSLHRYWELERLSGRKHHYQPLFSATRANTLIATLLADEGLSLDDMSEIVGTPGLFRATELVRPAGADEFSLHTLSHLYSALMMHAGIFTGENIFGMAMDAAPDMVLDSTSKLDWYVGCVAIRGDMRFVSIESPGPLYSAATRRYALEAGTLMALSSATEATIDFNSANFWASKQLRGAGAHPTVAASEFIKRLDHAAVTQVRTGTSSFTLNELRISAVMKHVDLASRIILDRNVTRLQDMSGIDPATAYLSTSGGFALNCPANSWLLKKYGFKGLLTPPCADDSGQALGIGVLHAAARYPDALRSFRFDTPYLGSGRIDVGSGLRKYSRYVVSVSRYSPERAVEDLRRGPVAWVSGNSEIGPRALGHRSLLCAVDAPGAKDAMNRLKGRQWWRPVAPLVTEEDGPQLFDLTSPSPYMLQTARPRPEWHQQLEPVLHLDGTARVQTLAKASDPVLYDVIARVGAAENGPPVLCNTSLNDKGEPIIQTAGEAINFCVRKGVGVAYLSGLRVELTSDATLPGPAPRESDLFDHAGLETQSRWHEWIPGADHKAKFMVVQSPELDDQLARLGNPGLRRLARLTEAHAPTFGSAADAFLDLLGHSTGSAGIDAIPLDF